MIAASMHVAQLPAPARVRSLSAAGSGDPRVGVVRTLVVGAGIAGLTLGGLLCRQERPPVIVERSASAADGYAIGLYPLGSCVAGLCARPASRQASVTGIILGPRSAIAWPPWPTGIPPWPRRLATSARHTNGRCPTSGPAGGQPGARWPHQPGA
jgi:hypothetical protein